MKLELIYFRGCANAQTCARALDALGLPYLEVRQDELRPTDLRLQFSSPTLLADKQVIIFGSKLNLGEVGACSVGDFSTQAVTDKIKSVVGRLRGQGHVHQSE